MNKGVNKVFMCGNICYTPELRHTRTTNVPITNSRLAVHRMARDRVSGERREHADFFDLLFVGDVAIQAARGLVKGCKTIIEGRLDCVGEGQEYRINVQEYTIVKRPYLGENEAEQGLPT